MSASVEPLGAALLPEYAAEVAWAPDQDAVAVACADGGVWIVDPEAGSAYEVARHAGGASRVAYSPTGLLASCGQDGRVALGTGVAITPGGWLEHLAWRPDGALLAVATGRRVQVWSPQGELAVQSPELPATVEALAFHPAGGHVAAATHGGVSVVSAEDGSVVQRLDWTGTPVALAFSPGGLSLACGTVEATVMLWDLVAVSGRPLTGPERKVRELAWRVDGTWLAAGGGSAISVWAFADGTGDGPSDAVQLAAHRRPVSWLGFRPRSPMLASAAPDGYVVLWNLPAAGGPWAAATLEEPVTRAAWSPDGGALAAAGARGKVAVFRVGVPE